MIESVEKLLVCPNCKSPLRKENVSYSCAEPRCSATYPIVDGIPVLIDDRVSTFQQSAYGTTRNGKQRRGTSLRKTIRAVTPRISANFAARKNFAEFGRLLREESERPLVLIVGGAEVGAGLKELLENRRIEFIETDVAIGSRTALICDASYLPFKDQAVDGVIVQAVLEYLPDPALCVAEIHRVLKTNGIVYSEMPFMQDVHGGRYDFTRLTLLGHRRLFRRFGEISSGACAGPATALAWSIQHFCLSFASAPLRDPMKFLMGSTLFWLKYFDCLLAQTPAGLDAATGTYLLAKKGNTVLGDRELIAGYRGAVPKSGIV
jgi:uncharacterized protein YbaR (Trm112 family)/SAM-dependent methyltransferase